MTTWKSSPKKDGCSLRSRASLLTLNPSLQIVVLSRCVLQCVAVCCSVLQCVAVCCSVLQRVAVCCSVLQCVANRRIEQVCVCAAHQYMDKHMENFRSL